MWFISALKCPDFSDTGIIPDTDSRDFETEVNIQCKEGYILTGDGTLTCNKYSEWSGNVDCVGKLILSQFSSYGPEYVSTVSLPRYHWHILFNLTVKANSKDFLMSPRKLYVYDVY